MSTGDLSTLDVKVINDASSKALSLLANANITAVVQDSSDLLTAHLDSYQQAKKAADFEARYADLRPHPAAQDLELWAQKSIGQLIEHLELKLAPSVSQMLCVLVSGSLAAAIKHYSQPAVIWGLIASSNSPDIKVLSTMMFEPTGKTWAEAQSLGGVIKLLASPPSPRDGNKSFLRYAKRQIFLGAWRRLAFSSTAPLHTRLSYIINAIVRENTELLRSALRQQAAFLQLHAATWAADISVDQEWPGTFSDAQTEDELAELAKAAIPSVLGRKVLDVHIFGNASANTALLGSIVDRVIQALAPVAAPPTPQ